MPLTGIFFRDQKGSALTSPEIDSNWRKVRDFVNSQEQLFLVRMNPDGTLKPGAIDNADIIKDGTITEAKLADDAKFPAGSVVAFAGTVAPAGWFMCDGTTKDRIVYKRLFDALGGTTSRWGQGDGSNTFHLPKMERRVPMGAGGTIGSALIDGGVGNLVGDYGGEEKHLLTGPQSGVQEHFHDSWDEAWKGGSGGGGTSSGGQFAPKGTFQTKKAGPTSATEGHNTVQPVAIFNFIIKY